MGTKYPQATVCAVATLFIVGATTMTILAIPVLAQQNMAAIKNGSMSSVMMESVRMHLKTADKALSTGNFSNALEQMNLAQMQLSVMGMKNMGTMNQSQAMGFMKGGATNIKTIPENCIILNDGSLECKDSLTNSYSFTTP
jgi:hypothetical protein